VIQVVLKSSSKEDTNLAREIHHHRQFLHPHIARLYEVVVTESLVWLALEFCPGRLMDRAHFEEALTDADYFSR
jgi:serine/threonine protein kinase